MDTLEPIGDLCELRYLSLANPRANDKTLAPLFRLCKLETFEAASWWSNAELAELLKRNPQLAV